MSRVTRMRSSDDDTGAEIAQLQIPQLRLPRPPPPQRSPPRLRRPAADYGARLRRALY